MKLSDAIIAITAFSVAMICAYYTTMAFSQPIPNDDNTSFTGYSAAFFILSCERKGGKVEKMPDGKLRCSIDGRTFPPK